MNRAAIVIALCAALFCEGAPLVAAPMRAGRGGVHSQTSTGAIQGTAQSAAGQTLSNVTVQLRNLQTGQIAGTTTSSATGGFSFAGLDPANYVIEVVNQAGVVVGSSAAVTVASGTTTTVTVSASANAGVAGLGASAASAGGLSTAIVITTIAATAGIVGAVAVAVNGNASPSR